MSSHKRRLIPIVDRQFQFKYTAIIMGVAAVVSAALGYFLLDAYRELNSMIEISSAIGQKLDDEDAQQVFALVVGFLGAEVLILGVAGLLITHRVVGPVFVLHRHFATLAEGKYPSIRGLRRGDEFLAAFETFSAAIDRLREQDEADLSALKDVLAALKPGDLSPTQLEKIEAMISARQDRLGR